MQTTKTAVSIQKALFDQADTLARRMKVSRSRLFALALEDYIQRQENRQLLKRLDAAYADEPDAGEQTLRRKTQRAHRRIVEREE